MPPKKIPLRRTIKKMNENGIISKNSLDPANIKNDDYTNTLAAEALRVGLFSETDVDRIRNDLLTALAEVIGYYTKNDSSSLKMHTAQQLSKSLMYNIDTYLLSLGNAAYALETLREHRMSELYGKGYIINQKRHKIAVSLYGRARVTRLKNACEEYNKTLDKYFKNYLESYDPKFSAHDKIYLSLSEYSLDGAYHIDGAIAVLEKIIKINVGDSADYEITTSTDSGILS